MNLRRYLKKISSKSVEAISGLWWNKTFFSPTYGLERVNGQLPLRLKSHVLYIMEEDNYMEEAAMLCPCKCGAVLHLNLLPDDKPCWKLAKYKDGTPSLHPSIWRQVGCRSHFFLKHGKIIWAKP